jgi:Tol biopolymer transport system component
MRRCLALLLCCSCALQLSAEQRIADIRQGTNLSVAMSPDGATLVVELLGQLWSFPAAGGGATPLTAPGERVRHPRYSPDGRRVVYQRLIEGQWDLWLLDVGTSAQRALTATTYDEREPDFSADGSAVVFAANRTGHYCLWSIALEGGVETQLTEEEGDASFPNVSELGAIAYVLDRGTESALRALASNGVGTTIHTSTHRLSAPTWRPGGGVVVFGEQDAPQSNRLQMLVLGEPRVLKPLSGNEDLFDTRAAWVSGAEFIYAADGQLWRRGLANPTRRPVHVFAALAVEVHAPPTDLPRLDSTGPRDALGINDLVRSPDGKRTAFTALGDLWLVERGEPEKLTDDVFVDLDPVFWPDGESIVFASERTGQFELWRLMLRDRQLTQLTFGALKPHRPAVRPDGEQIAFLETDGLARGYGVEGRVAIAPCCNGLARPR